MRCNAAAACLLGLAAGCAGHTTAGSAPAPSPTPYVQKAPTPVPVHVRGIGNARTPTILTETKNNRRRFTVRALSMEGNMIGNDGLGVFAQPHVTFVDKTGAITIADAPKATVKQRDNSIDMTGGVRARTADGGILTCDDLRYDATRERMYGEGHVVLTGPNGLQLRGDHLDGDVRFHDVRVTSGGNR
ncbi:MAG: LPS export ABC transporter periplasmic protein LptC [Candidatus Eremiobacteraeota bacterium]|nr:LPS export ABC transporter periplasmic protein LptC [Candidatus Eremiobacteraeota bacterium]